MTKTINTLVKDIEDVIDGKGGWDAAISEYCGELLREALDARLGPQEERRAGLRLSGMGTPCKRKLWYDINKPDEREVLSPATKFKFLFGDILEQVLISLAIAAGHRVEGAQDTLEVAGIKGHRDCVIDGITVDVKSASTYGFRKFKEGNLRDDDPFGYISQLSSYVYAGRSNPVESHPSLGAFLVVDKQHGHICLDMYDFGLEINSKEQEFEEVKAMVQQEEPPARTFEAVPDGKSGNMKLGTQCSYCIHKDSCWPGLRTFIYSNGPRFLTEVEKVPNVPEAT